MKRKKKVKTAFYIWNDQLAWLRSRPETMAELLRKAIDLLKEKIQ